MAGHDGAQALLAASRRGDVAAAMRLLAADVDVNEPVATEAGAEYPLLQVRPADGARRRGCRCANGLQPPPTTGRTRADGGARGRGQAVATGNAVMLHYLLMNGGDINAFSPGVRLPPV